MDLIDNAIATADREWRACGLRRNDRTTLAADLRLELESASADGVTPEQLLGTDLRTVARRLAEEAGMPNLGRENSRVVYTALAGAALGTVAGGFALAYGILPLVDVVFHPGHSNKWELLMLVVMFGIAGGLATGGAVTAVRLRLADLPRIRQTANAMVVLFPAAGVLVAPIMVGFAAIFSFNFGPLIWAVEAALAAAAAAGAAFGARTWSIRDHSQPAAAAA